MASTPIVFRSQRNSVSIDLEDRLLSPNEAAAMLGVSAYTIRAMARDREIPALKLGRHWRFRRSSLERWIEDRERKARCVRHAIDHDETETEAAQARTGSLPGVRRPDAQPRSPLRILPRTGRTMMHPSTQAILRYFEYAHLPEHLQRYSEPFHTLAQQFAAELDGPELTAGLRKLLEAKDCIVRAALDAKVQ
jgi:excisionase family DNA binding protein